MKDFVRNDTKANDYELGLERKKILMNKEVEDQRRRTASILSVLSGRKPRVGELQAIQQGFTRREEGDTNWMLVSTAAELAKAGFEAIITDSGDTLIKKVQKG